MEAITTERLGLQPWHERWRVQWIALAGDHRVTRWIGTGEPWDQARAEQVFDSMIQHWQDHGFGWRCAIHRESEEWMGFVGLNYLGPNQIGLEENEVEIGWWLKPEWWRQGFATEGAVATRDEAFDRLGLDRIVGRHHAGNPPSGRIMEKIGMTFIRDATGGDGVPLRIYELERERWLNLVGH